MRYSPGSPVAARAAVARWLTLVAALASAACAEDSTAPTGGAVAAEAAPAPSGAPKIAFDARTNNGRHVYTVNPDGTGLKRLTKGGSDNFAAAWSPDRRQIAFVSNRGGGSDIYVMDPNGKNVRRLTNFASSFVGAASPSWSPDGTTIVFEADIVPTGEIFVVPADGSAGPTRLTFDSDSDRSPVFSPDGSKIAFASTRITGTSFGLYVMSANGQNIRQIMSCAPSCKFPSWSPDGTGIAFLQGIASNPHMLRVQSLVDGVPQGGPSVLAENVTESGRPRWSPDNSEIAVVAEGEDGQTDVYAVPAGGGTPRRITNSVVKELLPSWAQ